MNYPAASVCSVDDMAADDGDDKTTDSVANQAVNQQYDYRANNGNGKTAKVKTIYPAIAKVGTDITADHRPHNAQYHR